MDKVDLVDTACPRLGLVTDQRSHLTFAHSHHRCHGRPKSAPIEPEHQKKFCLTRDHATCERFRAWQEETAAGRALLMAHVERSDEPPNGPGSALPPDGASPSPRQRRRSGRRRQARADG